MTAPLLFIIAFVAASMLDEDAEGVSLLQVSRSIVPMKVLDDFTVYPSSAGTSLPNGVFALLVVILSAVILTQACQPGTVVPRKTSTLESSCEWSSTLHEAAASNDINQLRARAVNGDVDHRDAYDRTPLHAACAAGHCDAARFLLQAGANASAQDFDDCTPLVLSGKNGHHEVMNLLLDAGANAGGMDDGSLPPALASVFLVRMIEGTTSS